MTASAHHVMGAERRDTNTFYPVVNVLFGIDFDSIEEEALRKLFGVQLYCAFDNKPVKRYAHPFLKLCSKHVKLGVIK